MRPSLLSSFYTRVVLVLAVVLLLTVPRTGWAQGWPWATTSRDAAVVTHVVSARGNMYVVGHMGGDTCHLGGVRMIYPERPGFPSPIYGSFLAKLDSTGAVQWINTLAGIPWGVVVDSAERVTLVGVYYDSVRLGVEVLRNLRGGNTAFVAQADGANGVWRWARGSQAAGTSTSSPDTYGEALAIDARGDLYITGNCSGRNLFGTLVVDTQSSFGFEPYVAKISANGFWQWVAIGDGGGFTTTVATGSAGEVFIGGQIREHRTPVTFGTITLPANGNQYEAFVARLDAATGAWQWVTTAGAGSYVTRVAYYGRHLYMAGVGSGPATTFGPYTAVNPFGTDGGCSFVACVNATGGWEWGQRGGRRGTCQAFASGDTFADLTTTATGEVLCVGGMGDTLRLGAFTWVPQPLNTSYDDLLLVRLDSTGQVRGAITTGGPNQQRGADICLGPTGDVYVLGYCQYGPATFGNLTIPDSSGRGFSFAARVSRPDLLTAQPPDIVRPAALAFTCLPNPAHQTVLVRGARQPIALLDPLGRVVRRQQPTSTETTLDLRGLPAGLYMVRAGGASSRLVVE